MKKDLRKNTPARTVETTPTINVTAKPLTAGPPYQKRTIPARKVVKFTPGKKMKQLEML